LLGDGSNGGTAEMVEREFRGVRVDRSERSLGPIVQRNRAAGLASTEILFSIDDDAYACVGPLHGGKA
jgi:hypothetical protein